MTQPITLRVARTAPRLTISIGLAITVALLVMPFLALLPATHPLAISTYTLTLVGKILCYAVVAVALDLVWGYAGLLSLGHGLFFALGGYAMGMYLMRQAAGEGLPAFMSFLSWRELPWFWTGTDYFVWALCLSMLVPGLLALIFGFFAFRSKIKGVYFSIMTQALTYAGMLLFFRNETGFGGNNRLYRLYHPARLFGDGNPHPYRAVYRHGAAAAAEPGDRLRPGAQQIWPGADCGSGCGEPPDVLWLRPARFQAVCLDALRRAMRPGRGALCAAGRHYQSG